MPRPTQGHVVERPWADGTTISYGARVRAYGRYEKVTFGTNKEGWNRTRAELETERIVQQLERGLGFRRGSSRRTTASSRRCPRSACGLPRAHSSSFGGLGRLRISEISPQLVDRFRDELLEQAETIRKAQSAR